jgi:hypothetical protein
VPNSAASARVVRLVRKWISTSRTLTTSGMLSGRAVCGGSRRPVMVVPDGLDLADG